MAKKKPTKRTRLVRGRDFAGWIWQQSGKSLQVVAWSDVRFCSPKWKPEEPGEWVRVKFVKV
jgi:hypothetical protein